MRGEGHPTRTKSINRTHKNSITTKPSPQKELKDQNNAKTTTLISKERIERKKQPSQNQILDHLTDLEREN